MFTLRKLGLLIGLVSILVLMSVGGIVNAQTGDGGDNNGPRGGQRQGQHRPPPPRGGGNNNGAQNPPPVNTTPTESTVTTTSVADEVIIDASSNLVVQWNEVMLAAVRNGSPRPTVISRSLYLVHAAMYDAWSMYDTAAIPTALDPSLRQPQEQHTYANKAEAVSQAAYQMLITLFPQYEANTAAFSNLLAQLGYAPYQTTSNANTAAQIGYQAAQSVFAQRLTDGSNMMDNYAEIPSALYSTLYTPVNSANPSDANAAGNPNFDPNRWQPLRVPTGAVVDENGQPIAVSDNPASYIDQTFLTPHWGSVTPFALSRGDQFRPSAPPQVGSNEPYTDGLGVTMTNDEAYWQQVNQIITISANLTDVQKVTAEYWADGPRSETPPGHWNALAHGISFRDEHTLDEDIQMFFALNGALFDASIAAWDAKRTYDYIRPASAIRNAYANTEILAWGGPGQGTQMVIGGNWQPYQATTFVTPAFAEYVSGHSTFSAAAAEVLTLYTGSNQFYDGVTVVNEDFNNDGIYDLLGQHIASAHHNRFEDGPATTVVLQWNTFQDAAAEAGLSRLYGGIHFQDGDLFGRILGRNVGTTAFQVASSYWSGTLDTLVSTGG